MSIATLLIPVPSSFPNNDEGFVELDSCLNCWKSAEEVGRRSEIESAEDAVRRSVYLSKIVNAARPLGHAGTRRMKAALGLDGPEISKHLKIAAAADLLLANIEHIADGRAARYEAAHLAVEEPEKFLDLIRRGEIRKTSGFRRIQKLRTLECGGDDGAGTGNMSSTAVQCTLTAPTATVLINVLLAATQLEPSVGVSKLDKRVQAELETAMKSRSPEAASVVRPSIDEERDYERRYRRADAAGQQALIAEIRAKRLLVPGIEGCDMRFYAPTMIQQLGQLRKAA